MAPIDGVGHGRGVHGGGPAGSSGSPALDALGDGNLGVLLAHLSEEIDVTIGEREADDLTKAGAATALRAFFAAHDPRSFTMLHQGHSRGGHSSYVIGNLETSDRTYRTTILFRDEGGKKRIASLRFDPE